MTGLFSRNVGKLFSELKLVLSSFMQEPTDKPLKVKQPKKAYETVHIYVAKVLGGGGEGGISHLPLPHIV